MSRRLIVAIDGPAGAGKSTVARHLAAHFGLLNLETGAMYRAFALKAMRTHTSLDNAEALGRLAAGTSIGLEPTPSGNRVVLDGEDVTGQVREPEVTQAASKVSIHPTIRTWMVDLQRALGAAGGVVMEGRDIGTVVFPDADLKFFLDASPEARSQRRYEQSGGATAGEATPEAVLKELRERDQRDRNRAESPLRPAEDAILIDSTSLTLDQVLARIESIVQERVAARV
ncbi:(d)CMP kinase [Silvibacterium dinghuense]|uniref:Cytidylate kinase n=1 Tax=Silvibacterium dinghuense TaxID=1560006 RepID=A0A4Q1SJC7_9BACT|nr:(d)CMP kinase [Silvibacterium dinghuense]RXS97535.1 (d)CMP kinase [Silvibacterium dinghuense]GGG99827.1 cytidylate kinase [Silvibacterium dinghuense]